MQNFDISVESIINDLLSENRKLVLESSTLRAALYDIRQQADALSEQINGGSMKSTIIGEQK